MKFINCRFVNDYNLGDYFSNPFQNVKQNFDWTDVTIKKLWNCTVPVDSVIVFGGGGLFHNSHFNNLINNFAKRAKRTSGKNRVVIWGAGLNVHGTQSQDFSVIKHRNFDLIGLRDFGNPFGYVPCASCLHPVFDEVSEPTQEVVIFEHMSTPIFIWDDVICNDNQWFQGEIPTEALYRIIKFLSAGETIITNTFHGAYWGLLLGRKVLLYKPFSNRFLSFPITLPTCDEYNWTGQLRKAVSIPNYLQECRAQNRLMVSSFKKLID